MLLILSFVDFAEGLDFCSKLFIDLTCLSELFAADHGFERGAAGGTDVVAARRHPKGRILEVP